MYAYLVFSPEACQPDPEMPWRTRFRFTLGCIPNTLTSNLRSLPCWGQMANAKTPGSLSSEEKSVQPNESMWPVQDKHAIMIENTHMFLDNRSLPSTACMHLDWVSTKIGQRLATPQKNYIHPWSPILAHTQTKNQHPAHHGREAHHGSEPLMSLMLNSPTGLGKREVSQMGIFHVVCLKIGPTQNCKFNEVKAIQPLKCDFQTTPLGDLLNWELFCAIFFWFCSTTLKKKQSGCQCSLQKVSWGHHSESTLVSSTHQVTLQGQRGNH